MNASEFWRKVAHRAISSDDAARKEAGRWLLHVLALFDRVGSLEGLSTLTDFTAYGGESGTVSIGRIHPKGPSLVVRGPAIDREEATRFVEAFREVSGGRVR